MALLLFLSMMLQAGQATTEALDLLRQAEEKKAVYLEEAKTLKIEAQKQMETYLKAQQEDTGTKCYQEAVPVQNKPHSSMLIFVSLSMPESSLQSLYREAEQVGAVLILRGLKSGSFKQTAEVLKSLKISVQVDPELFKKYDITRVPTFVLLSEYDFQSISGNVSLQYAKKKLLEAEQ
jgi:conjugal transfer pilus assembly protein TrbC